MRLQRVALGAVVCRAAAARVRAAALSRSPRAVGLRQRRRRSPSATIERPLGVYVTNEVSGDLSVIDPATHSGCDVASGQTPTGIRVAPDRKRLYIALSGSPISPPGTNESKLPPPDRAADGIGVVDVRNLTLGDDLARPAGPRADVRQP